jgi:tetratricopeptide (TPR) repeat protein
MPAPQLVEIMQQEPLPAETSISQASSSPGRLRAAVVVLALVAILAAAAAAYFWREQRAAAAQRAAAQAQAAQAERHFKDAKGMIDAMVAGLADRLAATAGMKAESAETILGKLTDAVDKLVEQTGNDPDILRSQGAMYVRFADTYLKLGDAKLAVESARKGTAVFRALAEQKPDAMELQSNIGLSLEKVGEALRAGGDIKGSLTAYRESLEIARAIAAKDPGNNQWRIDLVLSLWRLAAAGDQPRERLTDALKILKNLKLQAALSPEQEQWTAMIERDLTNLK